MPVKLNTAAILREGARIQKAEEEEIKKYSIHILTLIIIISKYQTGKLGSWWKG